MTLTVRLAGPADALGEDLRQAFADAPGRLVWVALLDTEIVGHALVGALFGHPLVERLRTAEQARRRGVGSALMAAIEQGAASERLFAAAAESDTAMRTLLAQRGYQVSGIVENLAPGDPMLLLVRFTPAAT